MSHAKRTTHPLILAAAGSVILASGVGIANWFDLIGHAAVAASTAAIATSTATAVPTVAPTLVPSPTPSPTASATLKPKPTKAPAPKPTHRPSPTPTSHWVNQATPIPTQAPQICQNCGRVVNIQAVEVAGEAGPGGVLLGGAAGGLLGNQVGKGNGKTLATIAGVIGGVMIGTQVEKQFKKQTHYDVTVQFEDGSARTIQYPKSPALQIGQRVKLINGTFVSDL
nr:glycine zipper 2TM domain-containing protein [uncultured Deefgea sp.]